MLTRIMFAAVASPSSALCPVLTPATPADAPFLFIAYVASRDDEMAVVPWDASAKTGFLQAQFAAQQQHYLTHYANAVRYVVRWSEQLVGALWVARWPQEIRLMDMVILREFRNRGLGSQLIEGLITEARADRKPITLHTWEGNPASARFYARHGFQRISSDGMYARMEWQAPSH